jgi:hypothetical protein
MVVGTARLVFSIPGSASLKAKRKVVRRILDRTRHRFNVAIAEVEDNDVHRRAVLGLAVVSNDTRHAMSMLDTLVSFVATASEAPLVDRSTEIVHVGSEDHWGGDGDGWGGSGDDGWEG